MTVFTRFFRRQRGAVMNQTTVFARARLARTMPGETGARAASRYGSIVL